jgi:hypothetical protein
MCEEASSRVQNTIPLIAPKESPQVEVEPSKVGLHGGPFDGLGTASAGKVDGFAPYDPILGFVPNFFADFDVISGTFHG